MIGLQLKINVGMQIMNRKYQTDCVCMIVPIVKKKILNEQKNKINNITNS